MMIYEHSPNWQFCDCDLFGDGENATLSKVKLSDLQRLGIKRSRLESP